MQQEGTVADGSFPVALSGRVYCWADAAYGAIQPGDLDDFGYGRAPDEGNRLRQGSGGHRWQGDECTTGRSRARAGADHAAVGKSGVHYACLWRGRVTIPRIGRKPEIEREIGAMKRNIEVVEDITAQQRVALRDEDDLEPAETCLGNFKDDEESPQPCLCAIVGLGQNSACRQQFECLGGRLRNGREIGSRVEPGANLLTVVGLPRVTDEDVEERCRRLKALIV